MAHLPEGISRPTVMTSLSRPREVTGPPVSGQGLQRRRVRTHRSFVPGLTCLSARTPCPAPQAWLWTEPAPALRSDAAGGGGVRNDFLLWVLHPDTGLARAILYTSQSTGTRPGAASRASVLQTSHQWPSGGRDGIKLGPRGKRQARLTAASPRLQSARQEEANYPFSAISAL